MQMATPANKSCYTYYKDTCTVLGFNSTFHPDTTAGATHPRRQATVPYTKLNTVISVLPSDPEMCLGFLEG